MKKNSPEISIIIPVFNESESIHAVHDELLSHMNGTSFEIIYVDDGSNDGTDKILQGLCTNAHADISCISLYTRNGKASAQQTGIAYAKGRYIVFMDGDGQDDPRDIFGLLHTLKTQHADMVVGWRKQRQSAFFFRFISTVFNRLIRLLIQFDIKDINASLKIVRSRFVKDLPIYAGHYRFLPILLHRRGLQVIEKPVRHRKRLGGISKYSPLKMIGGGLDMFTIFFLMHNNLSPLRFFGSIGLVLMAPGFFACCYITFLKIVHGHIMGRYPLLLLGILFILSGMQLMCTGLLAELFVYNQAGRQRPPLIKDTCHTRPVPSPTPRDRSGST